MNAIARSLLVVSFALLVMGVGHAQTTLTAWGSVAQLLPTGHRLPFGVPENLSVTLETTTSSSYRASFSTNVSDPRINWNRTGEFQFRNVPTGVPLRLTIQYRFPSGPVRSYMSTYRFTYPSGALRFVPNAVRASGYMGDFVLDLMREQILRNERRF